MCDHTNMDVTILKDEVEVQLWEGARSSIAALMSVNANDCDCLSGANQESVDRRGLSLKAGRRTDGRTDARSSPANPPDGLFISPLPPDKMPDHS